MDFQHIKDSISSSPALVLDTGEIVNTLKALNTLRHRCGCKVLYSIKSLPLTSVLELAKPFVDGFSVSSLFEARLANEIFAGQGGIHLTTPGIRPDDWEDMVCLLTHISFNSLTQYQRFAATCPVQTSVGLRVNPKLSFLKDDRFDPCRPYSKLGVDIDDLWHSFSLDQVKGLHNRYTYSAERIDTYNELAWGGGFGNLPSVALNKS